MSTLERLKEEKDDKRRRKVDRSSVGQKDRWTRFAEAKRQKARAQAYWISTWRKEKLNDYRKKAQDLD